MAFPNGIPYFLPAERAQVLANYPHARIIPAGSQLIYISGISSRRGDNTVAGCTTDEATGKHTLDIRLQTEAVLSNIEGTIRGATAGQCGMDSVVNATVFLTDMADYKGMNEKWNEVWPDKSKAPSRTCIQVAALPNERLNVEIQCQALWKQ
ncbi:Endoribonuclease L-PSP/chorismate mutase-like protein [Microdochium trichocladiopsis]|uniref:Endoribonuclease L-PSP/chorismate mutase-like protein n=1 Tax=Microdochium trichocladiopsis TaxID=1682393 RepID=A0A9P8Y4T3_9PEZI|nr:Endoribonuclease L-PSP/chorismate mutase-like protein [Microdochium trichocladiopsis]KAH7029733.1 Endoribonuclease L-PSP/chorismate mutase-like protein [Microdochium trichocladiopsis]